MPSPSSNAIAPLDETGLGLPRHRPRGDDPCLSCDIAPCRRPAARLPGGADVYPVRARRRTGDIRARRACGQTACGQTGRLDGRGSDGLPPAWRSPSPPRKPRAPSPSPRSSATRKDEVISRGQLSSKSSIDKVRTGQYANVHEATLTPGRSYIIEVARAPSTAMDACCVSRTPRRSGFATNSAGLSRTTTAASTGMPRLVFHQPSPTSIASSPPPSVAARPATTR